MQLITATATTYPCGICNTTFQTESFPPTPCPNCNRIFCPEHRDKVLDSEISPDLCSVCAGKYLAEGAKAMTAYGMYIRGVAARS
ncbi:MAG: hypothetical protein WCW78_02170 [Candidatus Paceibacterota bacterium]